MVAKKHVEASNNAETADSATESETDENESEDENIEDLMSAFRKYRRNSLDEKPVPPPVFEPLDDTRVAEIVEHRTNGDIKAFNEFISKGNFNTRKGDVDTNVIDQGAKLTYNIPPRSMGEFFAHLNGCISTTLHFSEKQAEYSGIMLDFDFYQKTPQQIVTSKDLNKIIFHIFNVIIPAIEPSETIGKIYHAFVIRRPHIRVPKPNEPHDKFKDGWHILIPEFQVTKAFKHYIYNELQPKIANMFRTCDQLWCKPEDILDKNSKSVPVLYYGNCKDGGDVYKLTEAYAVAIDGEDEPIFPNPVKIPDGVNTVYELSLSSQLAYISQNPKAPLSPTWLKKTQYNVRATFATRVRELAEKHINIAANTDEFEEEQGNVSILAITDAEALHIQELLRCLDKSYSTDYHSWCLVVWAIANTSARYESLARWFSMRDGRKFNESDFQTIWIQGLREAALPTRSPVTIRSIEFWARDSNAEKYRQTMDNYYQNGLLRIAIDNEGEISHSDVAKMLHAMLRTKFVTDVLDTGIGRKQHVWYEFVVPPQSCRRGEVYKYRMEYEPDSLYLFIADHVPKVFLRVEQKIADLAEAADTEPKKKFYFKVLANLKRAAKKLGDSGFQNGIILQSKRRFRDRTFIQRLDQDQNVIGVANGVLKLLPQPTLIKSFHEFRVSKFMDSDYMPYIPDHPMIVLVEQMFRDIFIEPDAHERIMCALSTVVNKRVKEPIIFNLHGAGSNGKTVVQTIIQCALGDNYSYKAPMSLLTGSANKANEANSAHHMMKDKTHVYFDESEEAVIVNTTKIKELTSSRQSGRGLHRDQENFEIRALFFAISNFEWIVQTTDHGTWRRFQYYVPKVKFTSRPDPSNKFEKLGNKDFEDKYPNDPQFRSALLSVLVHWNEILYNKYGDRVLNVPSATIDRETEAFRNRNDTINNFITQMIVNSPGTMGDSDKPLTYTISDLVVAYSAWNTRNGGPTLDKGKTGALHDKIFNSDLQSKFRRGPNDTLVLTGYRILDSPIDPLRPNETYIGKGRCANVDVPKYTETLRQTIDRAEERIENLDAEFRTRGPNAMCVKD